MSRHIIEDKADGTIRIRSIGDKTSNPDLGMFKIRPEYSPEDVTRLKKVNAAHKWIIDIEKTRELEATGKNVEAFEGKYITDDEWEEFIRRENVPDGLPSDVVDSSAFPKDITFKRAWKRTGVTIKVDMPMARAIHMDRIREVRNEELQKTDFLYIKEMEKGPVTEALKSKREALRDIPQTFDLEIHQTPDSLKNAWPNGLPKKKESI